MVHVFVSIGVVSLGLSMAITGGGTVVDVDMLSVLTHGRKLKNPRFTILNIGNGVKEMTQFTDREVTDLTPENVSPRRELADNTAKYGVGNHDISWSSEFYSMPEHIRRAYDIIRNLKTSDEVAEYFREKGIKGKRGLLESCPIANWATGCGIENVQVDNTGLNLNIEDRAYRIYGTQISEFVIRFDNGEFPFLEAE